MDCKGNTMVTIFVQLIKDFQKNKKPGLSRDFI